MTTHPLYEAKDQEGIVYGPKIKSWGGWPQDVVPELRRLNNRRELRFDWPQRVFRCADCLDFIDSRGVAACKLNGAWICDDCIVKRVREQP